MHAAVSTCCSGYMILWVHVALSMCCSRYVLLFVRVALSLCSSRYMLRSECVAVCTRVLHGRAGWRAGAGLPGARVPGAFWVGPRASRHPQNGLRCHENAPYLFFMKAKIIAHCTAHWVMFEFGLIRLWFILESAHFPKLT